MQEVNPNVKPTEKERLRIVPWFRGNCLGRKKNKIIYAHRTGNTIEIVNSKISYPLFGTI